MKSKIKTLNEVNTIHPYRTKFGTWVYDDEDLGVFSEAFVMGSSEVIDHLVGSDTNFFDAHISAKPIPTYDARLIKIDKEDGFDGWYQLEGTEMENWLCACVTDYFPDYPDSIYVKISNKKS